MAKNKIKTKTKKLSKDDLRALRLREKVLARKDFEMKVMTKEYQVFMMQILQDNGFDPMAKNVHISQKGVLTVLPDDIKFEKGKDKKE